MLQPLLVPDWRERLVGNARALGLTPRQVECALLIVEGWSNREIGYRMHISESTVKNRVGDIMKRLWANNVEIEDASSVRMQIVAVLLGLRGEAA